MLTTEEVETLKNLLVKVKEYGLELGKALADLHDTHPYSQFTQHNYYRLNNNEEAVLKYNDYEDSFEIEDSFNGFNLNFNDLGQSIESVVRSVKARYDQYYQDDLNAKQKEQENKRKVFKQNISLYLKEFPDLKDEFQ